MGDVAVEIKAILDGYEKEVQEAAEAEMQKIAKEAAQKLKQASPKNTGKYARGWTVKKDGKTYTVYNKNKPGLTHLLEKGHAKVKGGRVPAQEHIKPVEDWAVDEVMKRIESKL